MKERTDLNLQDIWIKHKFHATQYISIKVNWKRGSLNKRFLERGENKTDWKAVEREREGRERGGRYWFRNVGNYSYLFQELISYSNEWQVANMAKCHFDRKERSPGCGSNIKNIQRLNFLFPVFFSDCFLQQQQLRLFHLPLKPRLSHNNAFIQRTCPSLWVALTYPGPFCQVVTALRKWMMKFGMFTDFLGQIANTISTSGAEQLVNYFPVYSDAEII